ncbi:hypothetical protein IFM89_022549 [Coptis chinensis]|uniref:Uncharacterized protein n=1 Tax=Coptis chinensis TaxID=261450 RepID=A0A835IPR4_9MAGN|nr:hypothetical protein IFM89_022549 [Coptis chinensis]
MSKETKQMLEELPTEHYPQNDAHTPHLLNSSNSNPRKPLFSNKPKPKFISRHPIKSPNLTLVANAVDSRPDSSSPPFNEDETVFVGDDRVPLEGVIQFDKPDFSEKINKWGRVALLSGGDVMALLLFSAIGRLSHGMVLSAYFLGGYGSDGTGMEGVSKAVTTAAKSWGVGIPLGLIIRGATSGHIPPVKFVLVTMGATAVLLIGWRALLFTALLKDKGKKNDTYKSGSPFELFEYEGGDDLPILHQAFTQVFFVRLWDINSCCSKSIFRLAFVPVGHESQKMYFVYVRHDRFDYKLPAKFHSMIIQLKFTQVLYQRSVGFRPDARLLDSPDVVI